MITHRGIKRCEAPFSTSSNWERVMGAEQKPWDASARDWASRNSSSIVMEWLSLGLGLFSAVGTL